MIEAPYSELDYSSDYLDEFHGFTDEDDNEDGFNDPISQRENHDFQAFDPTADPLLDGDDEEIPLRNRNGDLIIGAGGDENQIDPNEEFKYNHDFKMKMDKANSRAKSKDVKMIFEESKTGAEEERKEEPKQKK